MHDWKVSRQASGKEKLTSQGMDDSAATKNQLSSNHNGGHHKKVEEYLQEILQYQLLSAVFLGQ